jgi:hypothetical protein
MVPGALISAWAIVEHLLIGDLSSTIRRDRDGLVVPVRRSTRRPREGNADHTFLRNRLRAIVADALEDGLA